MMDVFVLEGRVYMHGRGRQLRPASAMPLMQRGISGARPILIQLLLHGYGSYGRMGQAKGALR